MSDDIRVHYQGSRVAGAGISVIVEGNGWVAMRTLDPPYTDQDVQDLTEKLKQQTRERPPA